MSEFFNPVDHFKTEARNLRHLFRGETWAITPMGLGGKSGKDKDKRPDQSGQALQTQLGAGIGDVPAFNLGDELERRRRQQQGSTPGAGTATLLGQ